MSSIPELSCVQMPDCPKLLDDKFSVLPMLQLQTLLILEESLPRSTSNIQFSSIVNLSIADCNIDNLFVLSDNALKLNYLKIRRLCDPNITINGTICIENSTNNLKTLHIRHFISNIDYLFLLLKQTPNLENLIISDYHDPNIINANKWQNFITLSLSKLKNLKFSFFVDLERHRPTNEQNLKEFQKNFWCNTHHWYIEYTIWSCIVTINLYTSIFRRSI